MFGLPGDSTPPSRFLRAVAYAQTTVAYAQTPTRPLPYGSLPTQNDVDAVLQVFHIMNCFDIPFGSVKETHENEVHHDYTIWTSVADLTNVRWYFRTYNDQSIRMVDLHKALEAAAGEVQFIPMNSAQPVVDTSTDFMSAAAA